MTAVLPVAEPREPLEPALTRPRRVRTRRPWPGIISFLFALLTIVGLITGIALATSDLFLAATIAAWVAVSASVLGVLAALVALILRSGPGWAAAALILCVIANPLVLTTALELIGGLWA